MGENTEYDNDAERSEMRAGMRKRVMGTEIVTVMTDV